MSAWTWREQFIYANGREPTATDYPQPTALERVYSAMGWDVIDVRVR